MDVYRERAIEKYIPVSLDQLQHATLSAPLVEQAARLPGRAMRSSMYRTLEMQWMLVVSRQCSD